MSTPVIGDTRLPERFWSKVRVAETGDAAHTPVRTCGTRALHVATTLAKNALGLSRPQYRRMYGGGLPTALSILADLSLLDQLDAVARGDDRG